MKSIIFWIIFGLVLLLVVLMVIFVFGKGTKDYASASGLKIEIPKFSYVNDDKGTGYLSMRSFRTLKSLQVEIANMLNKYEIIDCNGRDYYYNERLDYIITEYGLKSGIIKRVSFRYTNGRVCPTETKEFTIIDETELCDMALEFIYEDEDYKYYFNCIKSPFVYIEFVNKDRMLLKEAIDNDLVSIYQVLAEYPTLFYKELKE